MSILENLYNLAISFSIIFIFILHVNTLKIIPFTSVLIVIVKKAETIKSIK